MAHSPQDRHPQGGPTSAPSVGDTPAGPAPWLRVALGMFAISFGAILFAPLLPVMREVHDLSQAQVNFLLAIYIVGLVPALLFGGPLSDRVGRRALVRPSLLFSAVGTLTTLVAHFFDEPTSPLILVVGRMLTGVAVGLVMAAGASWLKEVTPAEDGPGAAARRATIATSAGFGVGPLVTGPVAEWLPGPDTTGLALHLVMILVLTPLVWTTSAPPPPAHTGTGPTPDTRRHLLPGSARSRHFLLAVASWAPWVFGCATTSFAALAPVAAESVGPNVAYTGLIAGVTMLTGAAVQPRIGRHADLGAKPHPAVLGLGTATVGMLLAVAVTTLAPGAAAAWLMIPTAMVLGTAYGIMMVSGLREVQRIAPPDELGALTGIFYSLTYVGFFVPFVIALIAPHTGYVPVFLFGTAVTLISVPLVLSVTRRG
ncbi:MFS transporter [uncultured Corynebacterium sp.]|uniref:MFS transporter n=1 Tax=uncultured Corynebacterium sp. TaxID=159447 RepID=UPI0025D55C23|nr:MFS transporter [uncultured Corynebacterium sp.]